MRRSLQGREVHKLSYLASYPQAGEGLSLALVTLGRIVPAGSAICAVALSNRHRLIYARRGFIPLATAASVQDRDGGLLVLGKARMKMSSIVLVWADGGYAGTPVDLARRWLYIVLEIVKKPKSQQTFELLPRRWVVEHTLFWLVRCRRLGRDYELPAHAEVMVTWAMVGLMARSPTMAPDADPGRQERQGDYFPNTFIVIKSTTSRFGSHLFHNA